MAVTNLTGYEWYGNDTVSVSSTIDATNIEFYDLSGTNFTRFYAENLRKPTRTAITYYLGTGTATEVYANSWMNPYARAITFTGGDDVTNIDLITWLEANGTLTAPVQTPPVVIKYKSSVIASMDVSGTKTLNTSGKYCEDDIEVVYVSSDTPTPTQDKSADPSTSAVVVTPDTGKLLSSVTINPITSTLLTSLDADFVATNIKKDVNMFGLVGTFEGGGGGGGQVTQGVFFLDYDGTVVEAWATADVSGKTALPSNPSHTGLVAQGWNWDLASIKSYVVSYPNVNVYVGQMYETASGLTEFDITLTAVTGKTVTFSMSGTKNWGDGSSDTASSHTYANYGNYTITCNGSSFPSGSSSQSGVFRASTSNNNRFWCTAVRISKSVKAIPTYCFANCQNIETITMPKEVTTMGTYAFRYCYSLKSATISSGVATVDGFYGCYALSSVALSQNNRSINNNIFYNCYLLSRITLPPSLTTLGNYCFRACYALETISIPSTVTSIGTYAFQNCSGLSQKLKIPNISTIGGSAFYYCYRIIEYDFSSATSVPSLSNTNAFDGINGNCKILVPSALLTSWKSATNWTNYASYIYGV